MTPVPHVACVPCAVLAEAVYIVTCCCNASQCLCSYYAGYCALVGVPLLFCSMLCVLQYLLRLL